MYLLTSNTQKIKEYEELGIEVQQGPDIKEVNGTIDEVIIYKILAVGPFILIEDTVLEVGGEAIVDAKYKLKDVPLSQNAAWITSLGYHDNCKIYVYRGIVKGAIVPPVVELGRSFEPCFIPIGANITLHELKQKGLKQQFSARKLAIDAYRNNQPLFSKVITEIPLWEGDFQNRDLK